MQNLKAMKEISLKNNLNSQVTFQDVEDFFIKHEEFIERFTSKALNTLQTLEEFRSKSLIERKILIEKDMEWLNKIEAKTVKEFKEHATKLNLNQRQLQEIENRIQESRENMNMALQQNKEAIIFGTAFNGILHVKSIIFLVFYSHFEIVFRC